MKRGRANRYFRYAATVAAAVLALALLANGIAYSADRRFDLTPNGRFSASPGAVAILQSCPRPINVRYYVSRQRPVARASVEREIISKLGAIAQASGREHFNFDAANDVTVVEDVGAASAGLAANGVYPITEIAGADTITWYSAVVLDYVDAPRPLVINRAVDASALEYDIAARAVRLRRLRPKPANAQAAFRALSQPLTLTYIYGVRGGDLPPEKQGLREGVEAVLERIRALAPGKIDIQSSRVSDSPLGRRCGITEEVVSVPFLPQKHIAYCSSVVLATADRSEFIINDVRDPQGLFELIAVHAWDMELPREKAGIFVPGEERREYSAAERKVLLSGRSGGMTVEQRTARMVQDLDYEAVFVRIDEEQTIPPDLGALILPRPCHINARQRYELEQYLAAGGHILLLHGAWHIPLASASLTPNEDAQGSWDRWLPPQEGAADLSIVNARRVEDTLAPMLAAYGVRFDGGILAGGTAVLPWRVLTIQQGTGGAGDFPQIAPRSARLELIPYAVPALPPHVLTSDLGVLPLRGAAPMSLDHAKLASLGLRGQAVLTSPPGSQVLRLDASRAVYSLNYLASMKSGSDAAAPPSLNEGWRAPALENAENRPVMATIEGNFPFDPDVTPPPFGDNDRSVTPGLGANFVRKDGKLIVLSSPDLFEHIDAEGYRNGAQGPLIGGAERLADASRRRLLSNSLDYLIFGQELIGVRASMTSLPYRRSEWSLAEVQFWTLFVVLLPAIVAATCATGVMLWRRGRRARYERAFGAPASSGQDSQPGASA